VFVAVHARLPVAFCNYFSLLSQSSRGENSTIFFQEDRMISPDCESRMLTLVWESGEVDEPDDVTYGTEFAGFAHVGGHLRSFRLKILQYYNIMSLLLFVAPISQFTVNSK
jgi:hypothetical protein